MDSSLPQMRDSTIRDRLANEPRDFDAANLLISLQSSVRMTEFESSSVHPATTKKIDNVIRRTTSISPDNLSRGEVKTDSDEAPSVVPKMNDDENIITQWIKCVNDMPRPEIDLIQFLGEYVLHKCVAMWHDKIFNRSFRIDSDFVLGFANSRIIWLELLSDLRSFIEQYGRRYAASMLRRTVFKNLRSVQDRSQPISKLALEWAVGAVNDLLEKGVGSRWHGQTVLSFCTKHNQFKYIDDNMQTNRGIQDAHNRLMMYIERRSAEKQNVLGGTYVA
jgi:hypothetical protein